MLMCINYEVLAEKYSSSCEFSDLDGDVGRSAVVNSISATFHDEAFREENSKFELLDLVINEINKQDCKLQDGRYAANFVMYGFEGAFKGADNWDLLLPKIQQLKNAKPNAAYPILAEAKYWIDYAWVARGYGFASSVTPQAWKLFNTRLTTAKLVLIQNKEIASTSPAWYELMFYIETGLNSTQEDKSRYFVEGIARHNLYLPLLISKRNSLEPKWGGSWKDVDDFINWAANNTDNVDGLSMYSRLYFGVFTNMPEPANFFSNTLVDWSKLKQGFDDIIRLHPKSQFNLNTYASMACLANDEETYLEIRNRIKHPIEWAWAFNFSVIDCDLKYRYKR